MTNAWLAAYDTADEDVGKRDFAQFFCKTVDSSSDKKFQIDEIQAVLGAMDINVDEDDVADFIARFDANGDGDLSFKEFANMEVQGDDGENGNEDD